MRANHGLTGEPLAQRAYELFAPAVILTRLLAHYDQIGLSDEQIRKLLDIKLEYRGILLRQWPKLVKNWSALDRAMSLHKINSVACQETDQTACEADAGTGRECFGDIAKIQAAITAEQDECLQQVYVHEKEVYLRRITAPLRHKLEPVIDLFGETKGGGRGKKK